jgi:hypothetical protein
MKDFLNKAITVVLPIFSGDELSFTIKTDGSVEFMRNNAIPSIFMHVDITQPLWAFWDIYGNTSRIRILGSCQQSLMRTSLPRQQSNQQLVQVESPTTNGEQERLLIKELAR